MSITKSNKERFRVDNAIKAFKTNSVFAKRSEPKMLDEHLSRWETYWMIKGINLKERTTQFNFLLQTKIYPAQPISAPKPLMLLEREIEKISPESHLFTVNEFSVYCVSGYKIPNLLYEIGRLREISFREVGEGTNKSIDLDVFDQYYKQLFIWDNAAKKIVGAYRIGLGKDIMMLKGRKGFYTNTLFNMNPYVDEMLAQSMEMGRSFIVKDYQRKPLSLLLLWKGILSYLLSKPEYRYLIGPVSISSDFSPLSQQLIVELIQRQHKHYAFSQYITPINPFQGEFSKQTTQPILRDIEDLQALDNYIRQTEDERIPVLLKKYIQLGAKIACFNVDPLFNNSLDGFIILDLMAVPREIIQSIGKDMDAGRVNKRFC